jgi:hypothetical protein
MCEWGAHGLGDGAAAEVMHSVQLPARLALENLASRLSAWRQLSSTHLHPEVLQLLHYHHQLCLLLLLSALSISKQPAAAEAGGQGANKC